LGAQEIENVYAWPIDTFKLRFIDFTKVVYCGGQNAQNRFSGHFKHLKQRFIDFTKVAFCDIQKAEISSQGFSTT
jgi:hypothetical protein